MNEYSVLFLNGITLYVTATDWKDAIIEAKLEAQRRCFSNVQAKMIVDDEQNVISNINMDNYTFSHGICGIQAQACLIG